MLPCVLLAQSAPGSVAVVSVNGQAASPDTGDVAIPLFYDTSITLVSPTAGQTVTISQTTGTEIIAPAGLLLALTISLPTCSPTYNGQFVRFSTTQAITNLTLNASGGSVVNPLTSLLLGGFGIYTCYGATSTWYRVG